MLTTETIVDYCQEFSMNTSALSLVHFKKFEWFGRRLLKKSPSHSKLKIISIWTWATQISEELGTSKF